MIVWIINALREDTYLFKKLRRKHIISVAPIMKKKKRTG